MWWVRCQLDGAGRFTIAVYCASRRVVPHGDHDSSPFSVRVLPKSAIPWQVTGNHWLSLPCIHPVDGSLYALGILHRGARAAVEFAGSADFEVRSRKLTCELHVSRSRKRRDGGMVGRPVRAAAIPSALARRPPAVLTWRWVRRHPACAGRGRRGAGRARWRRGCAGTCGVREPAGRGHLCGGGPVRAGVGPLRAGP